MALIKGGSPFGELSGKMGGLVFARNKAGAYVRKYVIPVNPNSLAQVNARANFSSSAAGWHFLDNLAKARWQSYATEVFSPKNTPNVGQFSGFAAHTALKNVTQNAITRLAGDSGYQTNAGALTLTTLTNYALTSQAPLIAASGTIKMVAQSSSSFIAAQMYVQSVAVTQNYGGTYRIGFGVGENSLMTQPTPADLIGLQDAANNEHFGFAIYMSNPVKQAQDFVQNPFLINIGYTQPIVEFTGVGTIGANYIQFTINDPKISTSAYQRLPSVGSIVRITIVQTTTTGQQKVIGSRTTTIT